MIMSRTNEFKAQSESFERIDAAITALDSLLQDVDKSREACSSLTEAERRYRKIASGLKDSVDEAIASCTDEWDQHGLDSSFFLRNEKIEEDTFTYVIRFIHPVYEHLWLTTSDGHNVCEELMPFLEITLEYSKYASQVKITTMQLETTFHLPEMRASIRSSQEDLEVIKQEAQRINSCIAAAVDTQEKVVGAVERFSSDKELKFEKKGDVPIRPQTSKSSPPQAAAKKSLTPKPEPKPKQEPEPEPEPEQKKSAKDKAVKSDEVFDLDDELDSMAGDLDNIDNEEEQSDTLPGVEIEPGAQDPKADDTSAGAKEKTKSTPTGRFSTITPKSDKSSKSIPPRRLSTLNPRRS